MWLDDAERRAKLEQEFVGLHVDLKRDASARAAQAILELLRAACRAGGDGVRSRIAGVDEAGRGPLAGPVVAAAVILRPGRGIAGLADSKVLSARDAHRARRARFAAARLCFGIGWADPAEIDALNILHATFLAMRRAVLAMHLCPHKLHRRRQPVAASRRPGRAAHRARHHRRRCHGARDQRRLDSGENRARSIHGSDGRALSLNMLSQATRAMRPASIGGGSRARSVPLASPQLRAGARAARRTRRRRGVGSPIWNGSRTSTRIPSSRPTWSVALGHFVHLRLHTEYSLLDGIVRVPELMAAVAAAGMPAVALTDQMQSVRHGEVLQGGAGGGRQAADRRRCLDSRAGRAHAALAHRLPLPEPRRLPPSHAARDALVSRGPAARRADARARLARAADARGADRPVGRRRGRHRPGAWRAATRRRRRAASRAGRSLCGDRFYLEVQRTGRAGEAAYSEAVLDLAREHGVPAVATNDVRFLTRAEFEAHEARVCIHEGALLADASRPRRYSEEQYLKTPGGDGARCLPMCRQLLENTRGDRQALLARDQARRLDAAGLPGAGRAARPRTSCARRRGCGLAQRLEEAQSLRGESPRRPRATPRGSSSSSASSAAWASPAIS